MFFVPVNFEISLF